MPIILIRMMSFESDRFSVCLACLERVETHAESENKSSTASTDSLIKRKFSSILKNIRAKIRKKNEKTKKGRKIFALSGN